MRTEDVNHNKSIETKELTAITEKQEEPLGIVLLGKKEAAITMSQGFIGPARYKLPTMKGRQKLGLRGGGGTEDLLTETEQAATKRQSTSATLEAEQSITMSHTEQWSPIRTNPVYQLATGPEQQ